MTPDPAIFTPFLQYGSLGILFAIIAFGGVIGYKVGSRFLDQLFEQAEKSNEVSDAAIKYITESTLVNQNLNEMILKDIDQNSHAHREILRAIEKLDK